MQILPIGRKQTKRIGPDQRQGIKA